MLWHAVINIFYDTLDFPPILCPNCAVWALTQTHISCSSVHTFGMKIPPPTKIDTPYGGKLIWRLPGGNKLIAHLKDKAKIRHRKRWSQVSANLQITNFISFNYCAFKQFWTFEFVIYTCFKAAVLRLLTQ